MKVETIKVEAPTKTGFKIINKADMTEDHKIFSEDKPKSRKKRK